MSDIPQGARRYFTPANALTFSRLILMPIAIFGLVTNHGWLVAFAIFAAWFTDLIDGRVARRMGTPPTPFGKALDSTVDFATLYCLFIAFYAAGRISHSQFAVLYLSMLTIITLQMFLAGSGRSEETASTPLSKLSGAFQYLYLLFLGALEILPYGSTLYVIHTIYFLLLTVAVVGNTVYCVEAIRGVVEESGPADQDPASKPGGE